VSHAATFLADKKGGPLLQFIQLKKGLILLHLQGEVTSSEVRHAATVIAG
jgi:hypothetical protein